MNKKRKNVRNGVILLLVILLGQVALQSSAETSGSRSLF